MDTSDSGSPAGDAAARRDDLARMAAEQADAVWSDDAPARRPVRAISWMSGDIGPKSDIAAGLRGLSVDARRHGGEVPYGTVAPGAGRYLLGAMLLLVALIAALLALMWWIAT